MEKIISHYGSQIQELRKAKTEKTQDKQETQIKDGQGCYKTRPRSSTKKQEEDIPQVNTRNKSKRNAWMLGYCVQQTIQHWSTFEFK